jgi:hypothetical protein
MDIQSPWRSVMKLSLGVATGLLMMAASMLLTGEPDLTYVLLMASPFLLLLGVTSAWLVWKRLTAPKWDGAASLIERASTLVETECPPDQGAAEAIIGDRAAILTNETGEVAKLNGQ